MRQKARFKQSGMDAYQGTVGMRGDSKTSLCIALFETICVNLLSPILTDGTNEFEAGSQLRATFPATLVLSNSQLA